MGVLTGIEVPAGGKISILTLIGYKIGKNIADKGTLVNLLHLRTKILDVSIGGGYKIDNGNILEITDKIFD